MLNCFSFVFYIMDSYIFFNRAERYCQGLNFVAAQILCSVRPVCIVVKCYMNITNILMQCSLNIVSSLVKCHFMFSELRSAFFFTYVNEFTYFVFMVIFASCTIRSVVQ